MKYDRFKIKNLAQSKIKFTIMKTRIEATTDPKLKGLEGEKHAKYHLAFLNKEGEVK